MSTGPPRVSILIPAYNAGPYLEALCLSIQAQTCQDFEALILNDGSTDRTLEVLAPFRKDARFRILSWDENRGVSQATLALFALARGEFWCHPGADDMLMPRFIEERLGRLEASPHAAMVHGPAETMNERGERIEDSDPKLDFPPELPGDRFLRVLLQHNIIRTSSIMVRMSLTKSILPFMECDWKYAQDWYFWILHAATRFDLLWDPRPLHKYRVHAKSLTTDPAKAAIRQAEIRLVPLCALCTAAQFSRLASQCALNWRQKLYHLWLRRACNLARAGALRPEWLELGACAFYANRGKGVSLGGELSKHFLGVLLTSGREKRAQRSQRFQVSGMAQMNDPIFQ